MCARALLPTTWNDNAVAAMSNPCCSPCLRRHHFRGTSDGWRVRNKQASCLFRKTEICRWLSSVSTTLQQRREIDNQKASTSLITCLYSHLSFEAQATSLFFMVDDDACTACLFALARVGSFEKTKSAVGFLRHYKFLNIINIVLGGCKKLARFIYLQLEILKIGIFFWCTYKNTISTYM